MYFRFIPSVMSMDSFKTYTFYSRAPVEASSESSAWDFHQSLGTILLPWEDLVGRFKSSHSGSSTLEKYFPTTPSCTWSRVGGIHCNQQMYQHNTIQYNSIQRVLHRKKMSNAFSEVHYTYEVIWPLGFDLYLQVSPCIPAIAIRF